LRPKNFNRTAYFITTVTTRIFSFLLLSFLLLQLSAAGAAPVSTPSGSSVTGNPKSTDQVQWEQLVGKRKMENPAYHYVTEYPGLPRVLLMGDSISEGYTEAVQAALKGKANVHRIPANGGSTRKGLAEISKWLGWKSDWKVVHFNFGLHDVARQRDANASGVGTIAVPVEEYVANLEKLVTRLQQTGATLIWASTTPVPVGGGGRVPGDERIYNAAAERLMRARGIRIDDLYAFIQPHLARNPALQESVTTAGVVHHDVHFVSEGNALFGPRIAAEIEAVLPTLR
jgi:lysophospholipase L1-like esterase